MTKEEKEKSFENNKDEKANKKRSIFIVSLIVVLFLLLLGAYYFYQKFYVPMNEGYVVSLEAQNEKMIDEITFSKYDYIEIKDINNETVETIELTKDLNELTLLDPIDYEDKIFNDWLLSERDDNREISIFNLFEISTDITVYEVMPAYQEASDFVLTFRTDENAKLIEDEQEVTYVRIPYQAGQPISEVLPTIEVKEDYNGDWTLNENVIENETEATEDSEISFQSYQDINNNNLDDLAESFTIEFETNAKQSIEAVENIRWEETVDLPIVEDDNLIFFDWYTEPELENIFTSETKVQNDLTLYADMKNLNDVVNESVVSQITRKEIAIQVEKLLNDRNVLVDEAYQTILEQEELEREELKQFNEENNIVEQQSPAIVQVDNSDKNKLHLITFLDPSNNFLFAFVAPYGQNIKVTDDLGRLVNEYAVRQQTHIILDEKKLISSGSELDNFHTEYKQVNEAVFIKVQPITK